MTNVYQTEVIAETGSNAWFGCRSNVDMDPNVNRQQQKAAKS